jgi:hypothetical protein
MSMPAPAFIMLLSAAKNNFMRMDISHIIAYKTRTFHPINIPREGAIQNP